ncbi:hypothetical protein [Moorena producens]|uniref:hypothetical protein n=1 Tax=Moorena producens TaxID=1155739 RepID=UPI003C71CEF7
MPQCAHWAHRANDASPHFQASVPRSSEQYLNPRSKTNSLVTTSKPTGNSLGAIAIAFGVAYGQSHKMFSRDVRLSMVPKPKLTNGTMNGYPLNVSLIRLNQRLEQGRWVDVLNYAQNSNLPPRGYWRAYVKSNHG